MHLLQNFWCRLDCTMDFRSCIQLILCLIISIICFYSVTAEECLADKDKDWSYDVNMPNGPLHWGNKYPSCNGKSQSPVNIITNDAVSSGKNQRLNLHGYNRPIRKVMIMNNGHHIHVHPRDGVSRFIILDGKKYPLDHFHFHWGNKTHKGSEDVIDSQRHTMEAHFIHRSSDGIVAVGGFLQESHTLNSAIANILSVKQAFEYEGDHYEGEIKLASRDPHRQGKIYLDDLIDNRCPYFEYSGSIGFPPCTEGIKWLICRRSREICSYQLNELFSLYSVKKGTRGADKCHLQNIYRGLQPLNGRKIYK